MGLEYKYQQLTVLVNKELDAIKMQAQINAFKLMMHSLKKHYYKEEEEASP
jgi:hypothetical protein